MIEVSVGRIEEGNVVSALSAKQRCFKKAHLSGDKRESKGFIEGDSGEEASSSSDSSCTVSGQRR